MGWERVGVRVLLLLLLTGCAQPDASTGGKTEVSAEPATATPRVVTEAVPGDSDDPAIWLDSEDPSRSLVLGTDKGGGIYVFDLAGRIVHERSVTGLGRMNNVDVEYGLRLGEETVDVAVATDRDGGLVRVLRVPEMEPIDGGGIEVFVGESDEHRRPMGVALYRRPTDGTIFVILSRKAGLSGAYLWQYRLEDDGSGAVRLVKVREFGTFSGEGEIEAITVDDALGYLYYSDEAFGIRKYLADPDAADADRELATFGTDGFREDREGISIYRLDERRGFILVSDQQAQQFRVFRREGTSEDPHHHEFIAALLVQAEESDGSEMTVVDFGGDFPGGLFVAMSDDRTFHFYSWDELTAGHLGQT